MVAILSYVACVTDSITALPRNLQTSPVTSQSVWSRAITRIVIEVDYDSGAAPFVSAIPGVTNRSWSIFAANVQRLFQGAGKRITIPTTLAEMQPIVVVGNDFTSADLVALSQRNRNVLPTADTVTYHVMVLNGYFRDASGRRSDILGGHLDGTGVIVIFRPVVQSTVTSGGQYAPVIVEQTTLVHEFGHAIGLVGNGVSPLRDHEDHVHGHHCVASACVMNRWVEGGSSAQSFVTQFASTGNVVMFDENCLADIDAAIASAR